MSTVLYVLFDKEINFNIYNIIQDIHLDMYKLDKIIRINYFNIIT